MNKCVHGFPGQKGFQILLQVICTFLLDLFVSRVSREEPALPPGHLATWPPLRGKALDPWPCATGLSTGGKFLLRFLKEATSQNVTKIHFPF